MHDEVEIIDTLRRGEQASALEMARAWVAAAPDNPQAQRLLALLLAVTGDIPGAHATLDRAIALAPDDGSLHYQRATLLVSENRSDEASVELDRSIGVDPNELRAYVMQAQIALGRGDLDEADRLARLAARVNPDHPWLLAVQGMVLLHRQQLPQAHVLLSKAAKLAPNDIQTRYGLGLSFLAQGHWAFAEQAFRGVLEKNPLPYGMRHMLADVIRLQGRHAEAAEVLEAGLAVNDAMPPDLMRFTGELWLMAGNHARALPLLRRVAAATPDDRAALDALIEALRRNGDAADARHTLETALAAAPHIEGLWSARLSFEPAGGDVAAIADRWQAAIPDSISPLHLHMWLAAQKGDGETARDFARRIIEREPGHIEAQTQVIEYLYQNDPQAAVGHIQSLLPRIQDPQTLRMVLSWLARAQDRAGQYPDAVTTWTHLDAIHDPQAVPLPARSNDSKTYPPSHMDQTDDASRRPVFLFGPPGAGVERVVAVLNHNVRDRVCADRLESPPNDPLQFPDTAHGLASGALDGATVVSAWRAALPARTTHVVDPIDWLRWWDNALLHAFRGSLPEAMLLLVLADPRDMLVDWLQRGTYVRYEIESQTTIATWLAGVLDQIATLIEGDLMPHRELRIDEIADDAEALAVAVGEALELEMSPPPALGLGRFPVGHWRNYREALAGPFALLTPVAQRLGYSEN